MIAVVRLPPEADPPLVEEADLGRRLPLCQDFPIGSFAPVLMQRKQ